MHDIVEEILPWILIGITVLSYFGSSKKEKKEHEAEYHVEPEPERESGQVADQAAAYEFAPDHEGVSDIVPAPAPVLRSAPDPKPAPAPAPRAVNPPMAAIGKKRLSERRRRLRRLIVMGEVLQPKFESNRF